MLKGKSFGSIYNKSLERAEEKDDYDEYAERRARAQAEYVTPLVEPTLRDQMLWDEAKRNNYIEGDSKGSGFRIFRFASRWARDMEKKIANNIKIDKAMNGERALNLESLSPGEYDRALGLLEATWIHGKELVMAIDKRIHDDEDKWMRPRSPSCSQVGKWNADKWRVDERQKIEENDEKLDAVITDLMNALRGDNKE